MAEFVVINTGPLICLSRIDALDVVGRLPFHFVSTQEVRDELDEEEKAGYLANHSRMALCGGAENAAIVSRFVYSRLSSNWLRNGESTEYTLMSGRADVQLSSAALR